MAKRVLIIGGGLSSKHAAETLMKKAKKEDLQVTIVQANRFVEWPLAMPACLVKPELHDKALATNSDKFQVPGVTYKYGVVEGIDETAKQVKLTGGGEMVPYDCLIVATGFKMPIIYPELGVTVEMRKQEVQRVGEAIKQGSCIVIAGGGPVGLELAGNVRGAYPTKRVVLLCREDVLGQWPEKQRNKVQSQLQKMNIEVMKGATDAPKEWSLQPGTIKFGGKDDLSYDVFLPVYSQGPNTKFLPEALLDGSGRILVNEHLQSVSQKELFAIGVSDVKEPFIGMPKLEGQWNSATANVSAMLAGKPLKKHEESAKFMKLPPVVNIGNGDTGYSYIDFNNVPPPVKCCCCCGLCGFPFCPPCWPCCACGGCGCCPCGYCCGPPEGKGPAKLMGKMAFLSSGFHFKGVGEAPSQQTMTAATY
jgi:NADH dehydrogenase FAD-containing subunit